MLLDAAINPLPLPAAELWTPSSKRILLPRLKLFGFNSFSKSFPPTPPWWWCRTNPEEDDAPLIGVVGSPLSLPRQSSLENWNPIINFLIIWFFLKRWTTDGDSFTEYRKIWCVVQMLLQPKTHKSLKWFPPPRFGECVGGRKLPRNHLPFFFLLFQNESWEHTCSSFLLLVVFKIHLDLIHGARLLRLPSLSSFTPFFLLSCSPYPQVDCTTFHFYDKIKVSKFPQQVQGQNS